MKLVLNYVNIQCVKQKHLAELRMEKNPLSWNIFRVQLMSAICKRRIKVSSRLKGGLERAH